MESRENVANIAFYRFVDVKSPEDLKKSLGDACQKYGLKGTLLIALEGINGMVAGPIVNVQEFVKFLENHPLFKGMLIKRSYSGRVPFKRLLVKVKKEILTDRSAHRHFKGEGAPKIKPEDLEALLAAGDDVVMIDVRNDFEVKCGSFRGALNPKTRSFSQFAEFVKNLDVPKSKKIVTYCTGGIRCEKGSANLIAAGFKRVFQLDGGILEYLRLTRAQFFEGSCFVFDERIALDHQLRPVTSQNRQSEKPDSRRNSRPK